MRTISSIAATIALAACGTATPDMALDSDGLSMGGDVPTAGLIQPAADVFIVPVTGGIANVESDRPTASIDPEGRLEDEEESDFGNAGAQEAGASSIDRTFDPTGSCEAERTERSCPVPELGGDLTEVQERQLVAIAEACEGWMKRGPEGYAMAMSETFIDDIDATSSQLQVTVCGGETVEAYDVRAKSFIDATKVDSIDSLYQAAADHVMNGDAIELEIDSNLLYIKRFMVQGNTAEGHEFYEVTTELRPIMPDPAG